MLVEDGDDKQALVKQKVQQRDMNIVNKLIRLHKRIW
jgi:hypothetical protein